MARKAKKVGFVVSFLLLTLVYLFLKSTSFQSWAADKLIRPIEKNGLVKIEFEESGFDILEGFHLRNLHVKSREGEDMLMLEELRISPRGTLLSILKNRFVFESILIEGANINWQHRYEDEFSNWHDLLASFSGDGEGPGGKPIDFSFGNLQLYDFHITYNDEPNEQFSELQIDALDLKINDFDLANQYFDISEILMLRPEFKIKNCKPPASTARPTENNTQDSVKAPVISIANLNILGGDFSHTGLDEDLNERYESVSEIDVLLSDLNLMGFSSFSVVPNDISFVHSNGLKLDHIGGERIQVNERSLELNDLVLRSSRSLVKFQGTVKSRSENLFAAGLDKLDFDIDIHNSFVNVEDLVAAIPTLITNENLSSLQNESIFLNSSVQGGINELRFTNTALSVPGLINYSGAFDIYNISEPDKTLLNLTVDTASVYTAKAFSLFPTITIPKELIRLGVVELKGFFDGFANSFATTLYVGSEMGEMGVDVQFDIDGKNQYSGNISLLSFDIGKLLNNDDFGPVSLSADIENGSGLTFDDMSASFLAIVDTFQFKGYKYSDIEFDGLISNKLIDGILLIDNDDLNLQLAGKVDLGSSLSGYTFQATVEKVDLCALNLSEFPCQLSFDADIDLTGNSLNDMEGDLSLKSVFMAKEERELKIDYIDIHSTAVDQGMLLEIKSNEIDAKIRGIYDVTTLHKVLLSLLVDDYPDIASRLNIKTPSGLTGEEVFDFAIEAKDFAKILSFLDSKQLQDIEGEFRGRWNYGDGLSTNSFNVKKINLSGFSFDDVVFNLDSDQGIGGFDLFIDRVVQANRILEGFKLSTQVNGDTIAFRIQNDADQTNRFDISGMALPWNKGYKVQFDKQLLNVDSVEWLLDGDASISFEKDFIAIDNFVLQGENMLVILDDIDNQGFMISLKGFDFSLINPFVDYDKMLFDGTAYIDIQARNILSDRRIDVRVEVPDFTINQDPFGVLSMNGWEKNNEKIDVALNVNLDTQIMEVRGYFDMAKSFIDADIDIIQYPMTIFEYIIDDGISGTRGTTDLKAKISGPLDDLKLSGEGIIENAGTRIDYTGGYYRIEDQRVTLDEKNIFLTGAQLLDDQGNVATITGGLRHNILGDFRADLSISSDNFIGLQTIEADNELYYGTAIGDITVSFSGPFDAVDIKVDAITHAGTSLNIPINTTSDYVIDKGFINFDYVSEQDSAIQAEELEEAVKAKGVDFEMNLSFTPEADINVIFDKNVNEILESQGTGNIQMLVKRDGAFETYGDYEVESGRYLYSAYGFIAKPFIIRRGGVVRWTGDPYNAVLDVEADYSGIRAPLDVFLSEFLVSASESVQQEASSRTNVALTMLLGGTLFEPIVNFDIDFPDVNGELKTYTDNKMRSLRTTENGINNQVFGLLVLNNFLPNNNPLANISGSTIGQTGNNTIQEFISSQLSVLISEYLSKNLSDDSFIQGIDLDIDLSQNTSLLDEQNDIVGGLVDFVPDEFGVNLRPSFKNDNLALSVGTNYVRQTISNNDNYLRGDFALDWFITDDKKLKLRFYGDLDFDEATAQRKQKYGFGINYRREFGKLSDLSTTLQRIAIEVNELSTQ